jgi:hypothetical protein
MTSTVLAQAAFRHEMTFDGHKALLQPVQNR